jgi:hypothetical protein
MAQSGAPTARIAGSERMEERSSAVVMCAEITREPRPSLVRVGLEGGLGTVIAPLECRWSHDEV